MSDRSSSDRSSLSVGRAPAAAGGPVEEETGFQRGLGLFDATMIVAGAMIGSGIFVVSSEMSRLLGSPGWLLVAWGITALLTLAAALSYGELAAMLPRAGGQYVYLREAFSPLWGFLYAWTFLLVILTGTIAAVGIAFARFAGVLVPAISETRYLIAPVHLTGSYAVSLSTAQLVAILMIALLTATNIRGLGYGRVIQNLFTVTKIGALAVLIVLGLTAGWNSHAVARNFGDPWTIRAPAEILPGLSAITPLGLFAALMVAQTGSLFAAESWHSATIVAGEVRDPRKNLPLAVGLGAGTVLVLYLLANVAYLAALPLEAIRTAEEDRVGTALLEAIFPGAGVALMAIAIMISTFGCNNGMILVGARTAYALARDGLFPAAAGRLNAARVPGWGLALLGIWSSVLVLPRTVKPDGYGNLYGDLLDYVISAALLFYMLTILGLFRLRRTRPDAHRPYRALGYPWLPALYIAGTGALLLVLFACRPKTTWPGLVIVLLGVPFYLLRRKVQPAPDPGEP